MSTHPMQPVIVCEDGVHRFKSNTIVQWLLDAGPFDMNKIAVTSFSDEDRRQFAQLIGYSVDGYGELSYAENDAARDAAEPGNSDANCIAAAIKLARGVHNSEDAFDICTEVVAVLEESPSGARLLAAERYAARTPEELAEREQLIAAIMLVDGDDHDEAERRVDAALRRRDDV